MPYEIVVIGVPIIILTLLMMIMRTNSGVVFFSVCSGSVLATQIGGEASLIGASFIKDGDLSKTITSIALITLPAIFSAIILRKSITPGKFVLNIIPSICASTLLVLLVVPLLPQNINNQLLSSSTWEQLQGFQPFILVVGVISSLMLLVFTHAKVSTKSSKHKKHH